VNDGGISTPSTTPITIPTFPVGNQVSALALAVGAGLGILAGDPVSILDPSGLNTLNGYVVSYAANTGALVCQIGMTYQFEIRRHTQNQGIDGYSTSYEIGVYNPSEFGPILSASLGNGIEVVDVGILQILIPEVKFKTLRGGTYQASLTVTDSVNTRQVFRGKLPVLHGGVSL